MSASRIVQRVLVTRWIAYVRDVRGLITGALWEQTVEYLDGSRAVFRHIVPNTAPVSLSSPQPSAE